MEKKRSIGVMIFAFITIVLALWLGIVMAFPSIAIRAHNPKLTIIGSAVLGDVVTFTEIMPRHASPKLFLHEKDLTMTSLGKGMAFFVFMSLLFILIFVFLSLGLLNLQNWARIVLIAVNGALFIYKFWHFPENFYVTISLFKSLRETFSVPFATFLISATLQSCSLLLYSALFVIFFTRPKVKEQFK